MAKKITPPVTKKRKARVGHPSDYKPEYCQQLIDYFDVEVVERIVDKTAGGGTSTHFETIRVPSILGFAAKIGVNQDTLYEWAKAIYPKTHPWHGRQKHTKFSEALTRAQALQDKIMFEYGAAGRLSNPLVAMYWTNKLGYKHKTESDVNIRTEQPLLGGTVALEPDGIPADDVITEDTNA